MSTDKNIEFDSQASTIASTGLAAGHNQALMSDSAGENSTSNGDNYADNNGQMTGPNDDRPPVWQQAAKALIILLVIFGLFLGGRWVWNNYNEDDPETGETTEVTTPEQQPLPINDPVDDIAVVEVEPEPIDVDDDIPALGPANPAIMTIGAAILAATLYRLSNLAHQPSRRQ